MRPSSRVTRLPELFYAGLNQRLNALKAAGADVIRLDIGSPDMPPAPFIIEALKRSAEDPTQHGYAGYAGLPSLRRAIAGYYKRRFDVDLADSELTFLIGSKEGVVNLHLAWLNPGEVSLVPDPGYTSYQAAPTLADAHAEWLPLRAALGWLPDLTTIPQETAKQARMLWLNYPNNPTGAVASLDFFREAVAFCRKYEILLCHDAPYMDVTFDGYVAPSLMQVPGAKEIAVEFNSVSKTYNMAGWRVGMVVGNPVAIGALRKIKTQMDSGNAAPVQQMAVAALTGDQGWVAERNAIYRERRDLCVATLEKMGFEFVYPKAGMYIWFRAPAGMSSADCHEHWREEAGVSIAPGHIYGPHGEGWMRISFAAASADRIREAMHRLETTTV